MKGLYNPRPVDDTPVDGQLAHGVTSNWAYDHAADLDAHTKNPFELIRTGEFFSPWFMDGISTGAIAAGYMDAQPFWVARDITIDRLAIEVTTGDAAKSARLGIYNNGTNLYPGSLLQDFGAVSVAGIAIVAAVATQALTKGLYWLACLSEGTPTIRIYTAATSFVGHRSTNLSLREGAWQVAQAYGALPDPFTAGGALMTAPRLILPRLLTLD